MSLTPNSTFRLSKEAKDLLEMLSRESGVSMTAVLELLIRDKARKVKRKVKR